MLFPNINFHCSGNINEDLDFEIGYDASLKLGCGATLQNVFWYFGGSISGGLNFRRQVKLRYIFIEYLLILFQVNKIVGCRFERQTDLNFDFEEGACNTFNQPDEKVLLCFHEFNTKQCHT